MELNKFTLKEVARVGDAHRNKVDEYFKIKAKISAQQLDSVAQYLANSLKACDGTRESLKSLLNPNGVENTTLAKVVQFLTYVPPSKMTNISLTKLSPAINGATPPVLGIAKAYNGMPYSAWDLENLHKALFPSGRWHGLYKVLATGHALSEESVKLMQEQDPVELPMTAFVRSGAKNHIEVMEEGADVCLSDIVESVAESGNEATNLYRSLYHMLAQRHVFHTSCDYVPNNPFDWDHRFPVREQEVSFSELEDELIPKPKSVPQEEEDPLF